MTPTEKWIFCLALVYAVPSFLSGVGMTVLFFHRQDVRRTLAMMLRFLSPELTFERGDLKAVSLAPTDESPLPDGFRPL